MNRLKLYANCDRGILLNFCIFFSNAAWRCAALAAFCVCCGLTTDDEIGGLGLCGCVKQALFYQPRKFRQTKTWDMYYIHRYKVVQVDLKD